LIRFPTLSAFFLKSYGKDAAPGRFGFVVSHPFAIKLRKDGARRIQATSATTHHQDEPGDAWKKAMEKMENKERFPPFHGTVTAISMNLFTKPVALVI
jgi:hypothetical protein